MIEIITIDRCPFCGDAATSFFSNGDVAWHVSCHGELDEECRGIDTDDGPGYITEKFAIEAWNKRINLG